MKLYTIGFTQKSAEQFFTLLKNNNVKTVLDIRLNNVSQLAGFAKGRDLEYFLSALTNINYIHDVKFSPTKEILDDYKKKKITWKEYEDKYKELMDERNIKEIIKETYKGEFNDFCLLCSEVQADKCHRRLTAEMIKETLIDEEIQIIHL